jgi:hypothetical protein
VALGKHTMVGDWYVRNHVVNASLAALAVIYSNASVAASVVASVGYSNNFNLNADLIVRMRQQGAAISGEVQAHLTSGRDSNAVNVATVSASAAALAADGTPLLSLYAAYAKSAAFTVVPSNGLAAGDTYTVDFENGSALRTGAVKLDVGFGMRGDFLSFKPTPSKYAAAVAYTFPLDRSGGFNQPWSANVSLNERFTYSK